MPRGNLETIYPRALVLSAVRAKLNQRNFKEAFTLMRKHRINMNLIYDHDPDVFVAHVSDFITQINNVSHVNLFLSDLVEEDVTQTMYTAAYIRDELTSAATTAATSTVMSSKVDVVCDTVKSALYALNKEKYLLAILTAHVRKSKPELDIALNIVKDLKSARNDGHLMAEEALKYMLFLVDVNELYDVALGTYDFQLVLMVAEKSQKDPKEYLPFLNELRKLESDYQKFTIDKYLKRYHKALVHISQAGTEHFEECLSFIKEQRLYPQAVKLYANKEKHLYEQICHLYADYLHSKNYEEEAAVMYVRASQLSPALDSFTRCLNWRQCLCMANKLNYSTEQVMTLSRSLADSLKDRRQYNEAACLLEQYAQDHEEAIVTLIEGHLWDEALRLMHKYNRLDFVETNFKPSLYACAESMTESLREHESAFERYYKRLLTVRQDKEKRRQEILDHGEGGFGQGGGGGDSDLFSDTSSATGDSVISDGSQRSSRKSGSIHTRISGKSGKSRRKGEKKKKWSLKEGSSNEDCALIEVVANSIKQVISMKDELASLLKTLVLYEADDKAAILQTQYENLLKSMEAKKSDIWNNEQNKFAANITLSRFGPDSTANTIARAMQQQQDVTSERPADEKLDPVLTVAPVIADFTSWKLNILQVHINASDSTKL